ncbi:MAG TPA: HEAT repeat domain-containing protein [Anaerolineae bacterium]|nr:HEAT repeat domain-containing protein [Anaerolineae bacterium]
MDEIDELLVKLTDVDMNVRWKAVVNAEPHRYNKRVLDALLDRVADPEPDVRAQAARLMHWLYDERIPQTLIPLLTDRSPEVRAAAAEGLRGRYYRDALDALLARLHDIDPEVREAAAGTLYSYFSYRTVRALIWALDDESPQVRKRAAQSLLELDHYDAIQPLLRMALNSEEDSEVRQQAVESLGYLAHKDNVKFIDIIDDERNVVEQLIDLVEDEEEDLEVRRVAIEALERLGDEHAVVPLVALLCDWYADFGLRLGAVGALGNLKDFRVTPILIAALQDPEPLLRPWAASALGDLGDPAALPALDQLAQDEADKLGEAATKAAAQIRYELSWQEFDRVAEYARSEDWTEQKRALETLADWDDPRAIDVILDTLAASVQPDQLLRFVHAAKILANKGEARALPILAQAAEFWTSRNLPGMIEEAEDVADYIRRKLNGEELEPYIAVTDEEEYELDDLDEADGPNPAGNF